ncbi:MAG: hypothetical protein E7519_13770 [Ruminococcaceae bacterium]|nr:hypothetical protein [Oscillospiraceae bacterium]
MVPADGVVPADGAVPVDGVALADGEAPADEAAPADAFWAGTTTRRGRILLPYYYTSLLSIICS